VYGGGGITPDVIIPDTTTVDERDFERAVGRAGFSLNQLAFRFCVKWTNDHPDIDRDFVVTPEMREQFYQEISEIEDLEIDRELFDRVAARIDRFLEAQIANSAFGELEMFKRFETQSPMYLEAVRLLGEASTPEDLLSMATPAESGSRVEDAELVGAASPATDGGT